MKFVLMKTKKIKGVKTEIYAKEVGGEVVATTHVYEANKFTGMHEAKPFIEKYGIKGWKLVDC